MSDRKEAGGKQGSERESQIAWLQTEMWKMICGGKQ